MKDEKFVLSYLARNVIRCLYGHPLPPPPPSLPIIMHEARGSGILEDIKPDGPGRVLIRQHGHFDHCCSSFRFTIRNDDTMLITSFLLPYWDTTFLQANVDHYHVEREEHFLFFILLNQFKALFGHIFFKSDGY